MGKCYRCGEIKPLGDFAWRRKPGQHDSLCRPCRSEYGKVHYAANRERYVDQARRRKRALARERGACLIEFFRNHPSVDCAESDPVVLGFDHFSDKSFNIGSGLPYRNWQSILEEIAKCEVMCANCHRRRTARRGVHVRALLCAVIPSESGCRDSNPN